MYGLGAAEHLAADAHMGDLPIGDDRARDGESPFGVVRGFADPPLVFRIPHVSGDYRAGGAFETSDAMGIPMEHLVMRQHLRLLAYGVTGSDALEAADDAIGYSERHRVDGRGGVRSSRCGQRVGERELSVSGHAAGAFPTEDHSLCAVARAVPADEVDQPYV